MIARTLFLSLVFAIAAPVGYPASDDAQRIPPELQPQTPRFELRLDLLEFSLLHSAAAAGVREYGDFAEFRVRLVKEAGGVAWIVTIEDPRVFEAWKYWMKERTADILGQMDMDHLEEDDKATLRSANALNAKLEQAAANPIWTPVTLEARVVLADGETFLEHRSARFSVAGAEADKLSRYAGRFVVAKVVVKRAGEVEVQSFLERKDNTLELFVMSHCPYAKSAEASILPYLRNYPGPADPPRLEVRYIFYRNPSAETLELTSLHGEDEIQEDLIQIILRDDYAGMLQDYLLHRASSEQAWQDLAREIGLSDADIGWIQARAERDRESLMLREFLYATEQYGIYDGSPTYVWQSRRVTDLRSIEAFRSFAFRSPLCANSQ